LYERKEIPVLFLEIILFHIIYKEVFIDLITVRDFHYKNGLLK